MPRPIEHGDLITTSVKINQNLLERAKELNLNVSEICRQALLYAIGNPRTIKLHAKFSEIPKELIAIMRRRVIQNSGSANHWASVIQKKCGVVVTKKEIIDYCYR